MGRRTYLVACLVVLLLGGGLRLYRLADRSLWLDEAKVAGPEFVYGRSHRDHPEEYAAEFRTLVGAETREAWLIFSHVSSKEKRRLLDDLASEWRFQPVVTARGAGLYHGRAIRGAELLR